MTDNEILEAIMNLEEAYEQELSDRKRDIWIARFRDYARFDFKKAVESIIRTRERFPSIATVYKALGEIGAQGGKKSGPKGKPIRPYLIYRDPLGRTSVLCTPEGTLKSAGYDEPPKTIETRDAWGSLVIKDLIHVETFNEMP